MGNASTNYIVFFKQLRIQISDIRISLIRIDKTYVGMFSTTIAKI